MFKKKPTKELSAEDERFYRSASHVMAMVWMVGALTAVFTGMAESANV
ncbi:MULTISPECIES: hypothetical protein [Pseudomonas]|uniref:Uncharacterized protein n=2 Tax=Pseudomonas TaxID=286 RepID=A0A3G1DGB9_PSEAI|nr:MULTISPECIES: hypothetical protein [Pseudomonas]MCO6692665.1 hypothetical protein [Pseudomonas shirazica]AMP35748.1 Hypothetical protein [Pseudomonas aeruginosa]ESW38352.1 hypothetical protein O164_18075 [Pseudomonas taiwanensis SJ9]MBA6092331.1 hypothetical protein [Pseudomonas monteilii]MCE0755596.1 hypothetical protein [Pseudomonas asiatica]